MAPGDGLGLGVPDGEEAGLGEAVGVDRAGVGVGVAVGGTRVDAGAVLGPAHATVTTTTSATHLLIEMERMRYDEWSPARDHGDAWFRQGRRTFRCAPRYAVLPRKSERQPANWHKLLRSRCLVSERPPGLPSAGREGRESGGAARRPVGERAQDNRPGECEGPVGGRFAP